MNSIKRKAGMRPAVSLVLGGIATILFLAPIEAKGGKPQPSCWLCTPATATFRDATGDPTVDQIKSDGGGVYRAISGGEGAYINANGGLSILLLPNTIDRSLALSFSLVDQLTGLGCPAPMTVNAVDIDFRINTISSHNAGSPTLYTMPSGTQEGFGHIVFHDALGQQWLMNTPGGITITRNSSNSWTIDSPGSISSDLSCFPKGPRSKLEGYYFMPFHLTVTVP